MALLDLYSRIKKGSTLLFLWLPVIINRYNFAKKLDNPEGICYNNYTMYGHILRTTFVDFIYPTSKG